uniref:Hypothetical conserved protein n=1 Tax=uncultured Chloroflexota bacterium TaxID=166587 RepID=H5SN31_9CHLR|nr:hypothetical conserved protein [uncultured Chloroflexota bacterium]
MPVYERISVIVSLTLVGLALYFVLQFPAQTITFDLFGSPLSLNSPHQWLMILVLAGLVMAGTDTVIRAHPALPDRRLSYMAPFWMLPGLEVVLATQILGLAPTLTLWIAGLGIVGLWLWLTIIAGYHQVSCQPGTFHWTYLWHQFSGYAVVLSLFLVIYQTRSRSALSATGILLVSGMGALALLRQPPESISKTWLYAGVIALSLGQLTWALNYWRVSTLQAGLLLLIVFYVMTGLAQQQLLGRLSRRTLWEFGLVALASLVLIFRI